MKIRLIALFVAAWLCPVSAFGEEKLAGDWEGSLQAGGRVLKIEIQFQLTSRGLKAKLHVPLQNARNIPLTNVLYDAPTVHFERRQGKARAVFHGELKNGTIQGTFIQGKVVGRFLLKPKADEKTETLDSLKPRFKALSGDYSLTVMKLGATSSTVAQVHSGTPTSMGTCFTLYVTGTLVSDIKSGKRQWDQVIKTKAKYLSLPSGVLQTWPVGTPITLQSAATLMISQSDNTAADHLLFELGRKRVEAQQKIMGNNQSRGPFLSTFELFYLKNLKTQSETKKYLALNSDERRKYLNQLPVFDRKTIQFPKKPSNINSIEWFASTKDLCLAMDWLRKETEDARVRVTRDILAMKAGLKIDKSHWSYVGYKGGSEPGVYSLAYLLERKDGAWFSVAFTLNNSKANISKQIANNLVRRTLNALGRQKTK